MNQPSVKAWQQVWDKRQIEPVPASSHSILRTLLRYDGYETRHCGVELDSWYTYVQGITEQLQLQPRESFYEVGCGAGAFLYPLYEQGIQVAGCDFSATMVEAARSYMPKASFDVLEAQDITHEPFDYVVSNGVFIYFPNLDYAEHVVRLMVSKSRQGVVILEVSDLQHREEHEKLLRRGYSEEAYKARYQETSYAYYDQKWFIQLAEKLGVSVNITPQTLDFSYSPYRFNVFFQLTTASKG